MLHAPPPPAPTDIAGRHPGVARRWPTVAIDAAAAATFALLGLLATWSLLGPGGARLPRCYCGDPVQSAWFLHWVPWALTQGTNPFGTTWINAPFGANLAQNTLMPLLGVLTAPVTALAGPVAAFDTLLWLSFAGSGFSLYLVLRRRTGAPLPALTGGALFATSAYMLSQGSAHVMLAFVPLVPPLLSTSATLLAGSPRPLRTGALLGALVVAQFLIEPEVLAMAGLAVPVGAALVLASGRRPSRAALAAAARGALAAAAVAAPLLAYPVWYLLAGPRHFSGSNFPPDNPFRADLLGALAPTSLQRVTLGLSHVGDRLTASDLAENGAYLGPALLVALVVAVVVRRRDRRVLLAAAMAVVGWVLSLGPRLVVDGRTTHIPLPFAALVRMPLLADILPARFSLLEDLFVATAIALALVPRPAATPSRVPAHRRAGGRTARRRAWGRAGLAGLLVAAVALEALPRWPLPSTPADQPGVLSAAVGRVAPGATALVYPFPAYPYDQAMLWQAASGMRVRLLGGYVQNRSVAGTEEELPHPLTPLDVTTYLEQANGGVPGVAAGDPGPPTAQLEADLRTVLRTYHVGLVVDVAEGLYPQRAAELLQAALGPGRSGGGATWWVTANLS